MQQDMQQQLLQQHIEVKQQHSPYLAAVGSTSGTPPPLLSGDSNVAAAVAAQAQIDREVSVCDLLVLVSCIRC
jgi:hypothetical protein